MSGPDLVVLATVVLGFALVSRKLDGTVLTPAIIFVGAGFVLGDEVLGLFDAPIGSSTIRLLAEITLAMVLFTDASAINTRRLFRESAVPARLLGIGLPLTIVLGGLLGALMFPGLPVAEAFVLAILLAPTDAALGQAVVSDRRLPSPLRQGLNVESGLNDGICVPLLFAAIAAAEMAESPSFTGEIFVDLVTEVGVGVGIGLVGGWVAAIALRHALRRGWIGEGWSKVVPLVVLIITYVATVGLGGSGFIAAFVTGLVYGRTLGKESAQETTGLTEELGGLLSAVTFFIFGAVVIGTAITGFRISSLLYAVASLTLIRMVPVAVSLIGAGAARPTVAFAGWFGPRGLASIVFLLIIVEEAELVGVGQIAEVAALTVLLSVLAHGISAAPLSNRYVAWLGRNRARLSLESQDVEEVAPRPGMWRSRSGRIATGPPSDTA